MAPLLGHTCRVVLHTQTQVRAHILNLGPVHIRELRGKRLVCLHLDLSVFAL